MEVITEFHNKKLIKKYNNFYLRFIGGAYEEIPCDIKLSEDEYLSIRNSEEMIDSIFRDKKKEIPWNMDFFIDEGLKDYLSNEGGILLGDLQSYLSRLQMQEDIRFEMYETAMYETYPVASAIKVNGYSAEQISKSEGINACSAYLRLLEMREGGC